MKKIVLITLSSLFLAACFPQTGQQSPSTQLYSFDPAHSTNTFLSNTSRSIVSISPASIEITFASKSFVYRKGPYEYLHDPYRQFTAAPNILVTHFIEEQLIQQSNVTIIDPDSLLSPNYVLQLRIDALYADYQNKTAPKAITTIRATLFHIKDGETIQVSTDVFTQSRAITPNNPDDLMCAYHKNLSEISKKLASFLSQIILANEGLSDS